jgi:hypothetical protein
MMILLIFSLLVRVHPWCLVMHVISSFFAGTSVTQNFLNGYGGQVKFQSGRGIIPAGDLTPADFINVAGDINSSGGGSIPFKLIPSGPNLDCGQCARIQGGCGFNGGCFFVEYWLTTGSPTSNVESSSLSNAIFVGGWYTNATKFSMTPGTSGVYICPDICVPAGINPLL